MRQRGDVITSQHALGATGQVGQRQPEQQRAAHDEDHDAAADTPCPGVLLSRVGRPLPPAHQAGDDEQQRVSRHHTQVSCERLVERSHGFEPLCAGALLNSAHII